MFAARRLAKVATVAVVALFCLDVASAMFFDKGHDVHVIHKKVPYPVEQLVPIKVPYPVPVPMPPKTIIKKEIVKVPVKVAVKVPVKVRPW